MTIAVIIPAYNVEQYVGLCLESVLAQTYPDFRVYIMDDGSSDNTWKIIQEYAQKDKRILAFTHKNQGVTKTRNTLLDKLDDEIDFVFYLDADDFIHPQTFECLMCYMDKFSADVVEGSMRRVAFDETKIPHEKLVFPRLEWGVLPDMDIFWSNKTRQGYWITIWNKLYRWKSIQDFRFSEKLAYEEDYFYSCQINAHIQKKVLIPDVIYFYRKNPTSVNGKINFEKYLRCAINRIQLCIDTFLIPQRVPRSYLDAYQKDLALDAYRMILRKNLKKNSDKKQSRLLFHQSVEAIQKFQKQKTVDFSHLPFLKRMAIKSCCHHWYGLTKMLVYLAG